MASPRSPCYDVDFEEMMRSMRVTQLHSTVQRSPAARVLGLCDQNDLLCSPSPSSDLTVCRDVETPPTDSECWMPNSPGFPDAPPCSPVQQAKPKNLSKLFGAHFEKKLLLSISKRDDSDDSDATSSGTSSGSDDMAELDLNSTYSTKTMSRRKLSLMLNALDEDGGAEELARQPKSKSPNLELLTADERKSDVQCPIMAAVARKMLMRPKPEYLKPSPKTPTNLAPLVPERSFRLCNYARKPRTQYAGAHPVKEPPQIVDWATTQQRRIALRSYAFKSNADD